MSDLTWLYLKIFPRSPRELDGVVAVVVSALVGEYADEIERWHFLRFVDEAGPHIRLRCLIGLDAADEIVEGLPRYGNLMETRARIEVGYYDPEVRKWGLGGDLQLAEDQFQLASEAAVAFFESRVREHARWEACELAFASIADRLHLDEASRAGFFETHARWWLGPVDLVAAADRAPKRRSPPPPAFVDGLAELVVDFEGWNHRHSSPERLVYFAHHLIHLSVNRIGLDPKREGELAALLWRKASSHTMTG